MKKYRTNGAIGAILDEYEKAIQELIEILSTVSDEKLTKIVDPTTKDTDCHSIQTILTHLVRSGYGYAIYVEKNQGKEVDFLKAKTLKNTAAYNEALLKMFDYNCQVFVDYPNMHLQEKAEEKKIHTRWGQVFDIDQIFEHAIVHVLRHRRQIERFLQQIR